MRHLAVLATLATFLAISACGLKDNLYLPASAKPPVAPKPVAAPPEPQSDTAVPAAPTEEKKDEKSSDPQLSTPE